MLRIEQIISDFREYTQNEIDCSPIQKAYILAAKAPSYSKLLTSSHLQQALQVAQQIVTLRLDIQSVVAGLLFNVLDDGNITLEEIKNLLGEETANIINGLHSIKGYAEMIDEEENLAQNMRQVIFATSKDIRVVFVKLAVRLVTLKNEKAVFNPRIKRLAREALEIYAPIAERLGLSHIKVELEELSFAHLHPKEFKKIDSFCQHCHKDHQASIDRMQEEIETLLLDNYVEGTVKGRIKHKYSIFKKAKRKEIDYKFLHDILGIRIVVESNEECYKALGLISNLYRSIPGTFKDYISFPKPNGYQSLHTQLYSNDDYGFEVQIRTREMNDIAERGVAAHWAYKVNTNVSIEDNEHTDWLQNLTKNLNITSDPKESLEIFTRELYSDFVYVFTPKGKIIKLPVGASIIDFAYYIHSEIGHTCSGAEIEGKFCSIKTVLKHGDKIHIMTSSTQEPHEDWLKHAVTSRALSHVRQHLRKKERQEAEELGREIFIDKLKKFNQKYKNAIKSAELKAFLDRSNYRSLEEYLVQVGFGKDNINRLNKVFIVPDSIDAKVKKKSVSSIKKISLSFGKKREGVRIAGVENMMVRYAKCCNPVKGDEIIGIVTTGQGVSIHLASCENIQRQGIHPDRLVKVEWGKGTHEKFPVSIHIEFDDQIKTTLKITKALASASVSVLENSLRLVKRVSYQDIRLQIEDHNHLERLLKRLNSIPSVKAYRR